MYLVLMSFCEHYLSKSHTLFWGINEFTSIVFTCIVCFRWNSV